MSTPPLWTAEALLSHARMESFCFDPDGEGSLPICVAAWQDSVPGFHKPVDTQDLSLCLGRMELWKQKRDQQTTDHTQLNSIGFRRKKFNSFGGGGRRTLGASGWQLSLCPHREVLFLWLVW